MLLDNWIHFYCTETTMHNACAQKHMYVRTSGRAAADWLTSILIQWWEWPGSILTTPIESGCCSNIDTWYYPSIQMQLFLQYAVTASHSFGICTVFNIKTDPSFWLCIGKLWPGQRAMDILSSSESEKIGPSSFEIRQTFSNRWVNYGTWLALVTIWRSPFINKTNFGLKTMVQWLLRFQLVGSGWLRRKILEGKETKQLLWRFTCPYM